MDFDVRSIAPAKPSQTAIDRKVIDTDVGAEIARVADQAQEEVATEPGDSPGTMARSFMLLQAIGARLATDVGSQPLARPRTPSRN